MNVIDVAKNALSACLTISALRRSVGTFSVLNGLVERERGGGGRGVVRPQHQHVGLEKAGDGRAQAQVLGRVDDARAQPGARARTSALDLLAGAERHLAGDDERGFGASETDATSARRLDDRCDVDLVSVVDRRVVGDDDVVGFAATRGVAREAKRLPVAGASSSALPDPARTAGGHPLLKAACAFLGSSSRPMTR